MIRAISENPFRILGVCANSPMTEIVANKGKMNAFLKVGKQVSFPLDLAGQLGVLNRTADLVAAADSQLSIESNKLQAAQFWFFKVTQFDAIAFNHLSGANIDAAMSIWEKKESMSSLQNRAVCHLIKSELSNASMCLANLYENYRREFLETIDIRREVSAEELIGGLISVLTDSCPDIELSFLCPAGSSSSWQDIAKRKIVQPLIDKLTAAIATAKQSKGKGAEARLKAGRKLYAEAKAIIDKLCELLPNNDVQLVTICDKTGNEILQCGIDYYRDSKTPFAVREAIELQKIASLIVKGTLARQRCKDNGNKLQEHTKDLPPKEVESEYIKIQDAIQRYCKLPEKISYAVNFLNEVEAPLQSMGQKLGKTHPFYIYRSSVVVANAMYNVVKEINSAQNLTTGFYGEPHKAAVRAGWSLVKRLDSYVMDKKTRQHYDENKQRIRDLCEDLHISTVTSQLSSSSKSSSCPIIRTTKLDTNIGEDKAKGIPQKHRIVWMVLLIVFSPVFLLFIIISCIIDLTKKNYKGNESDSGDFGIIRLALFFGLIAFGLIAIVLIFEVNLFGLI